MPGMNISQKVFSKSGHRRRVRDINRIRPFHQLSLSSLFYLNRRKFWRKCPFQRFPHLPKLNWGALVPVRIWDLTLCVKPQNNSSIMSNMMQYPTLFENWQKLFSSSYSIIIILNILTIPGSSHDLLYWWAINGRVASSTFQSSVSLVYTIIYTPTINFTDFHDQMHFFTNNPDFSQV